MLMPALVPALGREINLIITASQNNLDLRTWIMEHSPWDGAAQATLIVTIAAGVVVGSASTGAAAMTIANFPAGAALRLINLGRIQGAGGAGGGSASTGAAGGPALAVTGPVTIDNASGQIWGGGGGGGGGRTYQMNQYPWTAIAGGTGGGGAGTGAGVPGGTASSGGAGLAGDTGQIYIDDGSSGGYWDDYAGGQGGYGGGPGQAGGSGQAGDPPNVTATFSGPGGGGAAGYYITGNTHITWLATGDRRGQAA